MKKRLCIRWRKGGSESILWQQVKSEREKEKKGKNFVKSFRMPLFTLLIFPRHAYEIALPLQFMLVVLVFSPLLCTQSIEMIKALMQCVCASSV